MIKNHFKIKIKVPSRNIESTEFYVQSLNKVIDDTKLMYTFQLNVGSLDSKEAKI